MPDLENRLPGRMVLVFALHPITSPAQCQECQGGEPAIGQKIEIVPPPFTGDPDSPTDMDDLYERYVAEQHAGIFRLTEFVAVGAQCLAKRVAMHQQREDIAVIAHYFATEPLPERLAGAIAVAPGIDAPLYPMVLGLAGPLSIAQMFLLINQPLGTLNAGLGEVLPG